MSVPQLAKLTPPRLGTISLRTRLFEQLDNARQSHPVIWIGAPAGAGKTTLVASYLQQLSIKPLWYSVDEGDADPASFFYYFGLACKQTGLRKALPLFTSEYQQGLSAFSRNYFRELYHRLKTPAVLVFDNYQDAGENAPFHSILQHALEEISDGICVFVISRSQPPAELTRLQTNNMMSQLRWEDLRLNETEHRALIAVLLGNQQLSEAQGQLLFKRTQGWITGVVLALRGGMFSDITEQLELMVPALPDNQGQMFDYFATEVLARTDIETREFLYTVAVLPVMTSHLCRELTGNPAAKSILKRLDKLYFFTTRHGILNVSYEFHPLFRQYLLAQAAEQYSNDQLNDMKIKATTLLLQTGEQENAVSLLIETRQWSQLVLVIKKMAQKLIKSGRYSILLEWIQALPESVREDDTWILYWHAAAIFPQDPFVAYDRFSRCYHEFSQDDVSSGMYLAWCSVTESLYFHYDEMQSGKYWIEELERLRTRHPRYPSIEIRGKIAILTFHLAMFYYPDHDEFEHLRKTAQRMFKLIPVKDVRCFIGALLSFYYSTWGYIDKLTLLADDIRPILKSTSILPFPRLQGILATFLQSWQTGDRQAAYHAIESGIALAENTGINIQMHVFLSNSCMVYLTYGDEARAEAILISDFEKLDPRNPLETANYHWRAGWLACIRHQFTLAKTHLMEFYDLLQHIKIPFIEGLAASGLVQVCIELEEFDTANIFLARAQQLAARVRSPLFKDFCCNYLEAYWHDRQGNTSRALLSLEKAFRSAHKYNWIVYSLWEKGMMTRLCVLALQHHIEPDYVKRLIRIYNYTPPEHQELVENWPYPVKLYTLGRFSLLIDNVALDLSGKSAARPIDLLKCLVSLGGRNIAQDKLIELLWPDAEGDAGTKAFHTTLYRLRKLILKEEAIVLKDGLLSLDPRYVWVDVWVLERALSQLGQACKKPEATAEVEQLAPQVMKYYNSPYLEQEKDQVWSLAYRERLHLRMLRTLSELAHYWQAHDHYDQAITVYERVLELDRLHEPGYQHLIQLYLQQGRHAEATATYERCRTVLSTALGVMPSSQTLALYQSIPHH